jgi:hypothetical protein
MDRRLLGNILIITLVILSGSGILMYFSPFEKNIASLHTFFALLFILAMVFHIINNKLPLTNYIKGKRLSKLKKFQNPLVLIIGVLITVGLYTDTPVLNKLYSWGNEIRNEQLGKTAETYDYQIIDLDKKVGKQKLSVELKKGTAFQYPLFAIWAEDSIGNYIETLYISRVISSSTFDFGKKVDDNWESAIVRRPEALPYWSHKRGVEASDGLYVPLHGAPDLDAVSGATPTSNFVVNSKLNFKKKSNYKIVLEVNQSYDWNEFYTKDKFPNDKIYSGSGQVGQPSLIYTTEMNALEKYRLMKLIGHGHHSGKNGKLYPDLSNITTAKNIADRIIVSIE